ncbi:hypothetical protein HY491_01830 [Candidatus Woesearchaeota archaeon]|nr:hypothetical protein [Candidatus Woesearchaeota archaeon]
MNKQLFLVMVLGLMLAASASAAVVAPRLGRLLYADDSFHVTVTNRNTDNPELDVRNLGDMSVRIFIPELGVIYRSNSFDVDAGDTASQFVLIDEPIPREYVVRVTVSNDDVRRVRHAFILP